MATDHVGKIIRLFAAQQGRPSKPPNVPTMKIEQGNYHRHNRNKKKKPALKTRRAQSKRNIQKDATLFTN